MLTKKTIAFIGSGNIAKSLVSGLIADNFPAEQLWVSGRNPTKLAEFKQYSVNLTQQNLEALQEAEVVVLCVKPTQLPVLCQEIKAVVSEKKPLLISVAAGISLQQLATLLSADLSILRAMPNTPCALQAGVVGLIANNAVTASQKELAESLFRVTGMTFWVANDDDLNKITVLAGSGPAYVFLFMEALQAAVCEVGFSSKEAELITKQMVVGAARMALETEKPVATLRQEVTSKGGTTEAAITKLQESGFEKIIKEAFNSGLARARFIESQLNEELS